MIGILKLGDSGQKRQDRIKAVFLYKSIAEYGDPLQVSQVSLVTLTWLHQKSVPFPQLLTYYTMGLDGII